MIGTWSRTVFGAVVLAAGEGRRLGGVAKALLPFDDELDYLDAICDLGMSHDRGGVIALIAVVVGPTHEAAILAKHGRQPLGVMPRHSHYTPTFVTNPAPERGMASSVALGFARLLEAPHFAEVPAAFLWPVDHPYVRPETLRALAAALGTHAVARPRYRERGGHPPLVARSAWPALAACADVPGGARAVIATLDTVDVPVDDPGVVRDVDTPADLAGPA